MFGGCATCQYMKMNSLESFLALLGKLGSALPPSLRGFEPLRYAEPLGGRWVAELGRQSISYMYQYQRTGSLPEELLAQIVSGAYGGRENKIEDRKNEDA